MRTDSTEREGVHAVAKTIPGELGWIFREQKISDYGIDAHIETRERNDEASGRLIAMQIRSGESYFKKRTDEGFIFRDDLGHLDYWLGHSLPVIVVLYNPKDEKCYWQVVTKGNINRTEKGWKMTIPVNQQLNKDSKDQLASLTEEYESPHISRFNELILSYPLIKRLERKERVLVEFDKAVGKHGYTSLKLIVQKDLECEETVELDNFVLFPNVWSINDLPLLFPWASFSIDEDFYYDKELEYHRDNEGIYDSEEKEIFYDNHVFREWRNSLPELRPYSEDENYRSYRLELSLNEIGRGFAMLYPYLEKGRTPSRFLIPGEWDGAIDV